MIVLGNPLFATGMKLAGVKDSYIIRKREDALKLLRTLPKDEFIIVNFSIIKMLPELEEFKNVISFPDSGNAFSSMNDLKNIVKSAVGIELNI